MTEELIHDVRAIFGQRFAQSPLMVVSPGRINLIGEHTDYNDGFVLPAAIDKSIVCAMAKNGHPTRCHVFSLQFNELLEFDLADVRRQPVGDWRNYPLGVVAELQAAGHRMEGFNAVFGGDIPLGAGLSSSAALENSFTMGLNVLFSLGIDKKSMALISQRAEHHYAGVLCGIMDQFASMFGNREQLILIDCRDQSIQSIDIQLKDHELLLINSCVKHSLSASEYNTRRAECNEGVRVISEQLTLQKRPSLNALRDLDLKTLEEFKARLTPKVYNRCRYVVEENARVMHALAALKQGDIMQLGALLFASHDGLQNLYEVSCAELDFLVGRAKNSPEVVGSRMMGGGFGGCTINLVKKGRSEAFFKSLQDDYKNRFGIAAEKYSINIEQGTHIA